MSQKRSLAAPCGLDCFNCDLYEANLTEELAGVIEAKLGVAREKIPCPGCRELADGRHFHLPAEGCATRDCVMAKGVEFCCGCQEFPCPFLAPTADGAGRYPHNMKLYNLCRIRKIGVEKWIAEEAGEVRRRYFKGKFVIGKGQAE